MGNKDIHSRRIRDGYSCAQKNQNPQERQEVSMGFVAAATERYIADADSEF